MKLEIDWKSFEQWLFGKYVHKVALSRLSYARKCAHYLLSEDMSDLLLMSDGKRGHVMRALCALSKFLGVYEGFSRLIKNYGLKWREKKTEDLIIDRLLKVKDPDEVFTWVTKVKRLIPRLRYFMDLITVTGLRYNETVNSYNLIVKLAEEGRLCEYFNAERGALEHFRFREAFIRRGKKVFISFVPEEVVKTVSDTHPVNEGTIHTRIKRKIGKWMFGDVREVYASVMTKHLRQPEIDFLQGRVSTSVFMSNYFNPSWIRDLKTRALKGAEEILAKVHV